jgi:hypothetical protein
MRRPIALLVPALLLCGNAAAQARDTVRDAAFREHVAGMFAADCLRVRVPNARIRPNAAQIRVLRRLCSCSVAQIRSSDIAIADGQDLVTRKVQQAQTACLDQVYGRGTSPANTSR